MLRFRSHLVLLAVGATSCGAFGQSPYPTQSQHIPGVPRTLERIDASFSDISPLGESLRDVNMRVDLRTPFGFNDVFRVPGRDDLLMRANGGMYAIFPQSVYVPSGAGMTPTVPPGTVFSIGAPGPWSLPMRGMDAPTLQAAELNGSLIGQEGSIDSSRLWVGSMPIDSRRRARRGAVEPTAEWTVEGAPPLDEADVVPADEQTARRHQIARATPPEPATFLKSVATDDDYRARRLAELMDAALRAATGDRVPPHSHNR